MKVNNYLNIKIFKFIPKKLLRYKYYEKKYNEKFNY